MLSDPARPGVIDMRHRMLAMTGEQMQSGAFMYMLKAKLRHSIREDMNRYPLARGARVRFRRHRLGNGLRAIIADWPAHHPI